MTPEQEALVRRGLELTQLLLKKLEEIEKKLGDPILIPRLEYDPKFGPTCETKINPLVWNDDL